MELKGSQTEKNLWAAFAGESQARNKYTYYASKAKKDGYVQISNIFTETANNEKEHAKIWFKLVEGIGDTPANLKAAAAGEHRAALCTDSGRSPAFTKHHKKKKQHSLLESDFVPRHSRGQRKKLLSPGRWLSQTEELHLPL